VAVLQGEGDCEGLTATIRLFGGEPLMFEGVIFPGEPPEVGSAKPCGRTGRSIGDAGPRKWHDLVLHRTQRTGQQRERVVGEPGEVGLVGHAQPGHEILTA
jgi:hypothetical protein